MKHTFLSFITIFLILTILFQQKKNRIHYTLRNFKIVLAHTENERNAEQRDKYFFRITRDPATNTIPPNIRQKEIAFVKSISTENGVLSKTSEEPFEWKEAGPNDVGGRTRALAIDATDSKRILAGGVSGGIWETNDKGNSWHFLGPRNYLLSVTSIVQDTRSGHTNTWYFAAGEFTGNSASTNRSSYTGEGIYKSTDNGITWNLLPATKSDFTKFDSPFDYVSKIIVNPKTGSVFVATNKNGILKSSDEGNTFTNSLGNNNFHKYSDIAVAENGTLVASISQRGCADTTVSKPGIYKSTDDGETWSNITPQNFPVTHERTVVAIAESQPNLVYVLTNTGKYKSRRLIVKLFKIDIDKTTAEDLSKNLPDFYPDGNLSAYCNYNFVLAVKPDDENFIIAGAANLFRSTDGFSTKPSNSVTDWIGGYSPDGGDYFNHHPDQHIIVFDKHNPNQVWSGHDGGISFAADITTTDYQDYFPWADKNHGYNVTQFYSVAIPRKENDNRIMGGTQDNGTPYFKFKVNFMPTKSTDLSAGDGSFAYFGTTQCYVSSQEGIVTRISYDNNGEPSYETGGCDVYPKKASGQDFINPFVIDPNNEDIMYYPAGDVLWRNNNLSSIPDFHYGGTTIGWTKLENIQLPASYVITAIKVSDQNPKHLLYIGISSYDEPPRIIKLENAETSTGSGTMLVLPDAPNGANIQDIAINPENGNEILVVLSNYNIMGLYHSANGGNSFTKVEGNLSGNENNPGPSFRSAVILPYNKKILYFVGTSAGLFAATTLNSMNTNWIQQSNETIGNAIVQALDFRTSDNTIAVATHGRGIFIGKPNWISDVSTDKIFYNFKLSQNYPNPFNPTTTIKYTISAPHSRTPLSKERDGNGLTVSLKIYNVLGKEVATLVKEKQTPRSYNVTFDGKNFSSGIYFYKFSVGNFSQTRKMLLIK